MRALCSCSARAVLLATIFCSPIQFCDAISVARAGTIVDFNFLIAGQPKQVQVELFDQDAPQTVANFLTYVNSGAYNNTLIHRMVQNFVVQGGGYSVNDAPFSIYAPANGISLAGNHIPTNAPIPLEYSASHPNTAGTLAMARNNFPNSATSEWFFNTVDNSSALAPGGSSTDGYAVFGQILGNGLQVIQQINALSTLDTLYAANSSDPYFTTVYANMSVADQQAVASLADTPFTGFNPDTNRVLMVNNLVVLESITKLPEPSTLALAAFGGLALVAVARRRAVQLRA